MSGQDGFLTFVVMMTAQLVTEQSSPFRQLTGIASEGDLLVHLSLSLHATSSPAFFDWFISALAVHLRLLLKALVSSGQPQNGYSEALLSLSGAYSSFVCLGCHSGKILDRDWELLSEVGIEQLLSNYRHCAMQVQLGPLLQDPARKRYHSSNAAGQGGKDGRAGWIGIRRPPKGNPGQLPKVVVPGEHYVLKIFPFMKKCTRQILKLAKSPRPKG
ncbi:hypothetical protein CK203_098992 [Vitis vinifera]|uniref:Uncharacterized protein n=1 Tax=Vitis vinifera TaxID=29760 RepID=A0A438CH89_VITVI|nr:hypothetical protein CK203_098992 [Vitis vinifera]